MKIAALSGLLGYGYAAQSLAKLKQIKVDVIGVDAGSCDPGPYYLGHGTSFTSRNAVKRDLELVLPYALAGNIPLIIGSAGGAGGNIHVAWLREIIEEIAREQSLSLRLAIIETEVSREYVKAKLRAGKVRNLSKNLPLDEETIDKTNRIVSQIGVDPFIKALDGKADVVLAGRACDTAIYAAPAIRAGFDEGLALHMAKIMECGALCATPMSAADIMVATIKEDHFILEPANPQRRCTVSGVAAHTLYEQGNPYYILEPNGFVDLRQSRYEQISDRAVKVENSRFNLAERTLKLEGTMLVGYRTISIAGIYDPATISRVDTIFQEVKDFVRDNLAGQIQPRDYSLSLRKYGEPLNEVPVGVKPVCDLGIIIDVVAKTQDLANTILALARSKMLHTDYAGRKSTAGNLAFPYSPSDISCGEVYAFSIYHLVEVSDLNETARITFVKAGE